jgi:ABC-type glycerol-3-phosphate transport system substrate-binding protein
MKKFSRTWLCVWLIVLFVTACGPAPTPAPTPVPTTLRFAYLGHEEDYQGLADEFHQQFPGVTIELAPISLREQLGGFNLLLEQFQEADVVRVNSTFLGSDQLSAVYPLDEFIAGNEDFPRQDFYPGSLEALQSEQHQMGLPAGLDPVVMFYENIRFKAASATPPSPDYTLEDFLTSARQVNNQSASLDSGNYSYGFCTTPLDNDPVRFTYIFGGGLYDRMPEPTQPRLNSSANVEAISWYARLWSEHALAPKVTDNVYQTYQYIASSTCGYWMNWLDMFGYADSLPVQGRVLPLPRVDETSVSPASAPALLDGYFITRRSPDSLAAWNWINFIVQRQEASLGQIPPLSWQIISDEYAQRASPDVLTVAQSLPADLPFFSLPLLTDPRSGEISNLFAEAVRQIIVENVDVQTALDKAQKQAEEIFYSSGAGTAQP